MHIRSVPLSTQVKLLISDFIKALAATWLIVESLSYFIDPLVRWLKLYGWAVLIISLIYAGWRLKSEKRSGRSSTGFSKTVWTILSLICLFFLVKWWTHDDIVGIVISALLGIYSLSVTLGEFLERSWIDILRNISSCVLGPILMIAVIPLAREPVEDFVSQFPKADDNSVNVLIADFEGNDINASKALTKTVYTRFDSQYSFNEVRVDSNHNYNISLDAERTNKVWTREEMSVRGRRRGADIGVVGNYKKVLKDSARTYHLIDSMQCVIVNDSLEKIFESKAPLNELYEFCVDPRKISFLSDSVSQTIRYVAMVAVNLRLLEIAIAENDDEITRSKILKKVNDNFAEIGTVSKLPAVSAFHQGNSYFHSATISSGILDKINMYLKADSAYRKSITLQKNDSRPGIIAIDTAKPYFNLAFTYRQLYTITFQESWRDLAETAYEQAAESLKNFKTVDELVKFLDERLGEEYKKFESQRIVIPPFPGRCRKILDWTEILEQKVWTIDQTDQDRNDKLGKILKIRKTWNARLKEYNQQVSH